MLNTNLHPYPVLIITNVTTSTHGSWWLPDRKRTPWEENWAQLFIWMCSSENRQEIHWLHSQLLMPYLEQEQKAHIHDFCDQQTWDKGSSTYSFWRTPQFHLELQVFWKKLFHLDRQQSQSNEFSSWCSWSWWNSDLQGKKSWHSASISRVEKESYLPCLTHWCCIFSGSCW